MGRRHCQVEAPGDVVLNDDGRSNCAACESASEPEAAAPPTLRDITASLNAIPVDWEDWELDDDLHLAERWAATSTTPHVAAPLSSSSAPVPVVTSSSPVTAGRNFTTPTAPAAGRQTSVASTCAWTLIAVSLMAFVCGAVLVGWSAATDRSELWRLGMPLTLIGQAGWLIGVLAHVEGLWQRQRTVAATLTDLAEHLEAMRRDGQAREHSRDDARLRSPLDTSDDENPQQLLSDLKRQLDALTLHYHHPRRAA